jgi:ribosomal protein L24E
MKHQPYEDWLLDETPITMEQKRELDLHLRSCSYCTALVETGYGLGSVKMAVPADGFTVRFQHRLAERKLVDRRRKIIGAILFLVEGLSFLLWLTGPSILRFLSTPEVWIASSVEWGIFIITTLQALSQAGAVVFRVTSAFLPPLVWMVIISAFAGLSLLWLVSIWRFTRVPQGV